MALLDVALIKIEILLSEHRLGAAHLNVGIALQNALLLSVRYEQVHGDARGHASAAVLAVRAIKMIAAAAKAHVRQVRIDLYVHWLAGVQEQGRRLLLGQVTAGVGLSGIKLQPCQLCHDRRLVAA